MQRLSNNIGNEEHKAAHPKTTEESHPLITQQSLLKELQLSNNVVQRQLRFQNLAAPDNESKNKNRRSGTDAVARDLWYSIPNRNIPPSSLCLSWGFFFFIDSLFEMGWGAPGVQSRWKSGQSDWGMTWATGTVSGGLLSWLRGFNSALQWVGACVCAFAFVCHCLGSCEKQGHNYILYKIVIKYSPMQLIAGYLIVTMVGYRTSVQL